MVLSSLLSYFKPTSSSHPIATQSQFLAKYTPLSDKPYARIAIDDADRYAWEMFRVRIRSAAGAGKSIVDAITTPFGAADASKALSSSDASQISGSSSLSPHKTLTLFAFKLDGSPETSFRGVTASDLSKALNDDDSPMHESAPSQLTSPSTLDSTNPVILANLRTYARSFIQRQKTIRHPTMLQYLDSFELEDKFFLVTEYCVPLDRALRKMQLSQHFSKCVEWGLFQIADALQFLHQKRMYHNALSMDSIFVVKSGDWKLANMPFLTQEKHRMVKDEDGASGNDNMGTLPNVAPNTTDSTPATLPEIFNLFANRGTTFLFKDKHLSPEMSSQDAIAIEKEPQKVDSWGIAVLIYEIFIGRSQPLTQRGQLTKLPKSLSSKIPANLFKAYKYLVSTSMKQRWDMDQFMHCDHFAESEYVDTLLFLQELTLKEQDEIDAFLDELSDQLENTEDIPQKCVKYRILPALVSCVKYGNVSKSSIKALFLLGTLLDEEEYKHLFVPAMIELFSMDNPLIQLNLLQNIEQIVQSIESDQIVEQKIFRGALEKWFQSPNSKIREMSVKALIPVVPRLSEACVDQIVVRVLWTLLGDSEGSIRTNTIIVTGKLAASMTEATREKILLPAVSKALKDPFKHSRHQAIIMVNETQSLHTPANIATKIIPIIAPRMMDPSAEIRQLTIDTMNKLVRTMQTLDAEDKLVPKKTETENEEKEDGAGRFSWALSSMKRVIGRKSTAVEKSTSQKEDTSGNAVGGGSGDAARAAPVRASKEPKYQPIFADEVAPQKVSSAKTTGATRSARKWSNTFRKPSAQKGSDSDEEESARPSTTTATTRRVGITRPKRLTRNASSTKDKPKKLGASSVQHNDDDDPFAGGGWEIDIPEVGSTAKSTKTTPKAQDDDDVFGGSGGWEIDIPVIPVMKPTQKKGNAKSDWSDWD